MKTLLTISIALLLPAGADAKRLAPADVPPVVTPEAIYSAPHFGKGGRSGVVEARHPETKELLWKVRLYRTRYIRNLETDVQDVFIKTLVHDATHRLLVASDEKGRVFAVDLETRKVTRVR